MKLRIQMLISRVVDPTAVRVQETIARFRVRRPEPWQCRHQWKPCPIVTTTKPGRYCPKCAALETRCDTQPLRHPESMAILLPKWDEAALAELDDVLWPNELL